MKFLSAKSSKKFSLIRIKTNIQRFVRSSASNSSGNFKRRSSTRKRRVNFNSNTTSNNDMIRQVRFKPNPTAIINISTSTTKSSLSDDTVASNELSGLDYDEEEVGENQDEFGWGSDFDHSNDSDCSSELFKPTTNAHNQETTTTTTSSSSGGRRRKNDNGGYLLEIGKSSRDFKAINNVIQDQGISGQFKRLDLNQSISSDSGRNERGPSESLQAPPPPPPPPLPSAIQPIKLIITSNRLAGNELIKQRHRLRGADEDRVDQLNERLHARLDQQELQQTSVAVISAASPVVGEFDCQSHYSDESGSCSGGEHSGSQDSGHSTQLSGFYAPSCVENAHHPHLRHQMLPSIESNMVSDSSLSPTSDHDKPGEHANDIIETTTAATLDDAGDCERRNRFLQNRLIINSKLESMFKDRSPNKSPNKLERPVGAKEKPSSIFDAIPKMQQYQQQPQQRLQQVQVQQQQQPPSQPLAGIDPETRLKLLAQQRQMSLKLKQKPRRKRINADLFGINSDSNSSSQNNFEQQQKQASQFVRVGSRRSVNRESLTKQLSMICLSQASQITTAMIVPTNFGTICGYANSNHQSPLNNIYGSGGGGSSSTLNPRHQATLSLRQLVKGVIDDCEQPNKLSTSTLTMNILNRSVMDMNDSSLFS